MTAFTASLQGFIVGRAWPALPRKDRLKLGNGRLEIVIDDDVVEFFPVRHVTERVAQPALNDRSVSVRRSAQSSLQFGDRRRQDEDGDALGH